MSEVKLSIPLSRGSLDTEQKILLRYPKYAVRQLVTLLHMHHLTTINGLYEPIWDADNVLVWGALKSNY